MSSSSLSGSTGTTAGQNNGTNYFSKSDVSRQLGLEVENQVFWVSKECLSEYSPVFKTMLYGKFDEAGKNIIPLPDKKAKDVLELLLCLFPTPVTGKIDYTNVGLLLAFADEYQMADLTSRCCDFFDIQLPKLGDGDKKLLDVLVLASKHRLHRVLFNVVERCAKCFGMEQFKDIFDQLASEVVGAITWLKFVTKHEALAKQPTDCPKCRSTNTANPLAPPSAKLARRSSDMHATCAQFAWTSIDPHGERDLWRCGIAKLLKRL